MLCLMAPLRRQVSSTTNNDDSEEDNGYGGGLVPMPGNDWSDEEDDFDPDAPLTMGDMLFLVGLILSVVSILHIVEMLHIIYRFNNLK